MSRRVLSGVINNCIDCSVFTFVKMELFAFFFERDRLLTGIRED